MALPHPFDRLIENFRDAINSAADYTPKNMRDNAGTWIRWLNGYINSSSAVETASSDVLRAVDDLAELVSKGAHRTRPGKRAFNAAIADAKAKVDALESALQPITPNTAGLAADPVNGSPR